MSIDLPSYQVVVDRIRSDIRRFLPDTDPTIFASLLRGLADSNAGRHFDNVLSIKQLEKELFPNTANLDNLTIWAAYEGLVPFPATQAEGNAVFLGVAGSIILEGSLFSSAVGNSYSADTDITISVNSIEIISLTRSNTTVTGITTTNHNFATNLQVTISGAVEIDYNGLQTIIVLSTNTFSYEITTTPFSPATGNIFANCDCSVVPLTSVLFDSNQNLDSGSLLSPTSPILGINEGFVDLAGIIGGGDTETALSLFRRVIQSRGNPVANFNVAAITLVVLSVRGVTRVKVKRNIPDVGSVTVLFVRDEDDNIIPSVAETQEVKDSIIVILQATSAESDVIVTAPIPVSTDFTFSSITPNTSTMKTSIENQLKVFYKDEVDFETTIIEDKYRSSITSTIDTETGEILTAFVLSTPTADIIVGTDSIGVLGTILFS